MATNLQVWSTTWPAGKISWVVSDDYTEMRIVREGLLTKSEAYLLVDGMRTRGDDIGVGCDQHLRRLAPKLPDDLRRIPRKTYVELRGACRAVISSSVAAYDSGCADELIIDFATDILRRLQGHCHTKGELGPSAYQAARLRKIKDVTFSQFFLGENA